MAGHSVEQEIDDLLRDIDRDLDLRLVGCGAQMRRDDHVAELEQRMVRRRRLFDEDIERRTGDFARAQRLRQRGLIDDSAARAIDNPHALFHFGERSRTDHPARVVGERRVHRDKVGALENLLETRQLDADPRRRLGGEERIIAEHLHLEADRAVGDDAADIAEPDHAQRLVAHFGAGELAALPAAGPERSVGGGDMTRERHHHRDRVLGGRDAIARGAVHHDYPAAGGGFEIDVVDPDARASDHLERFRAVDNPGGDFGRAANHERVVRLDRGGQLGGLETGLAVELDPRRIAPQHVHPLGRKGIAHEHAEVFGHVRAQAPFAIRACTAATPEPTVKR